MASRNINCYAYDMKLTTVSEYIDRFSGEQKAKLQELHAIIRKNLPDTDEMLKWGAPATLDKDGMILIVFSGHKDHMNLVGTPSTLEAIRDELGDYETGKGAIRLPYDKPLPTALIKKMLHHRADEYHKHGVKWK